MKTSIVKVKEYPGTAKPVSNNIKKIKISRTSKTLLLVNFNKQKHAFYTDKINKDSPYFGSIVY